MKPFMLAFLVAIFQTASAPFTVDQILSFPSPENLVASPVGSTIAWTFNERGIRNIYVADGPEFAARRVTSYTEDDGQELTQLSFSRDGKTIVYSDYTGSDTPLIAVDLRSGKAARLTNPGQNGPDTFLSWRQP